MITSTSNQQMKNLTLLMKKQKPEMNRVFLWQREEKCFRGPGGMGETGLCFREFL